MKTYDHETGDLGCRAVILKHFCSTASFWKLKIFITPLSENSFKRGVRRTKTFSKMSCVSANTRFAL